MTPIRVGLSISALAAVLAACGGPAQVRLSVPEGLYTYQASTSTGAPLLAGRMGLDTHRDASVTGTWTIGWAPGADTSVAVGPQVGTGMLGGSIDNGKLFLNLNPGWIDNNVFLYGTVRDGEIAGTWSYSTLVGSVGGGSFVARIFRR
ncbi:MAG: hypothetical protein HYR48_04620 [Gemmatimonadetes bacterium]|nr:hypothetical protein [Gemmatimonadota bacterium]